MFSKILFKLILFDFDNLDFHPLIHPKILGFFVCVGMKAAQRRECRGHFVYSFQTNGADV